MKAQLQSTKSPQEKWNPVKVRFVLVLVAISLRPIWLVLHVDTNVLLKVPQINLIY